MAANGDAMIRDDVSATPAICEHTGIYYLHQPGDGPLTLFLHGRGQSGAYWLPMLRALAAEGMAGAAIDLPGFGRSADAPGPYTMEGLAASVARFIELRGGTAMVVANSMGGAVAQVLTLDHPARVARLLLTAAGPFFPNAEDAAKRWNPEILPQWQARDVEASVRRFFQRPDDQPDLQRYYADTRLASDEATMEAMQSNIALDTRDRLHEIAVPTLIIQGRHDAARKPEHGELMAARIPDCRLVVLEGSGHTPHLDEPAAFEALAVPFLAAGRA